MLSCYVSISFSSLSLCSGLISLCNSCMGENVRSGHEVLGVLMRGSSGGSCGVRCSGYSFFAGSLLSTLGGVFYLGTFCYGGVVTLRKTTISCGSRTCVFLSTAAGKGDALADFLASGSFTCVASSYILVSSGALGIIPFAAPVRLETNKGSVLSEDKVGLSDRRVLVSSVSECMCVPGGVVGVRLPIAEVCFSSFKASGVVSSVSRSGLFLGVLCSPVVSCGVDLSCVGEVSALYRVPSCGVACSSVTFIGSYVLN